MKNSAVYICFLFLTIGFIILHSQANAQKNDTLYFLNGDRISGEILEYKYGYLKYKTYGVSTVKVKYDKMSTFYSSKSFDILFKDGRRRFGSFDTSYMVQFVNIVITNDTLLTPLIEIVEFTPVRKNFWRRLSGNLDLGISYTKANELAQSTFNGSVKYTQRNYFITLIMNSLNSIQSNLDSTRVRTNSIAGNHYQRIKKDWFGIALASGEQNSQLGLDLRLQGGLGAGNELVHTNRHNLLTSFGVVINKEWSATQDGSRLNVDGFFGIKYRLFRFNDPEIDLTSNFSTFPSFTVAKRWRIDYDINIKIKIITDMYFSISFVTSYDSNPPSQTSANLDYSFSTSFGYTFN
jgi:hypothetical protein